jgi:hypothetical protein
MQIIFEKPGVDMALSDHRQLQNVSLLLDLTQVVFWNVLEDWSESNI